MDSGDEVGTTGDAPGGIGDGGIVKPPVVDGPPKAFTDLVARVSALESILHDLLLHQGEMYVGAGEDRLALADTINGKAGLLRATAQAL